VLENERAVVMVEMLIEPQARRSAREQTGQRGLAHGKRIAAKIIPVHAVTRVSAGRIAC
jgi:hypothetical protein